MYIYDVCALTNDTFNSAQNNITVTEFWNTTFPMKRLYKDEAKSLKTELRTSANWVITRDTTNMYIIDALKTEEPNMTDTAKSRLLYLRSCYTRYTDGQIQSAMSRYNSEHYKTYNTFPNLT